MELNLESKKNSKEPWKVGKPLQEKISTLIGPCTQQRKAIKQSVIVHQIIDGPRTTQLDQLPKIG